MRDIKQPVRVVVTGIGLLTPIGTNKRETWQQLVEGVQGIGQLDTPLGSDPSRVALGAKVGSHPLPATVSAKDARHMPSYIQFALTAADEAMADARLFDTLVDPTRIGVFLGSVCGGAEVTATALNTIQSRGPKAVTPRFILYAPISMAAGEISIRYKLQGPQLALSTHGSSGTSALARAYRMIQYGDADVMLAGATDAPLGPTLLNMFEADGMLTQNIDMNVACQPFGINRSGWVLGEGAAMLVLEEYEHACRRGVPIYAELVGMGLTADARDPTDPAQGGEGLARSMSLAMAEAGVTSADVDLLCCHGESSINGDMAESNAVNSVMQSNSWPAFATKAQFGHTVGAAGAIDAALTVLAIHNQLIPPTVTPVDRNLVGRQVFSPEKRGKRIDVALTNAYGFGVNYSTLVWRRAEMG